jgi:DnaK suppressor protein
MKERIRGLIKRRLLNRRSELRTRVADVPFSTDIELREIEGALRRLGEGRYGVCHQCGELIAHGRLYSEPHTERCGRCVPPDDGR